MIRATILDFDGLMVYSEDVCLDAWQRTLAPYGKTMSGETYRSLIGTSQKHSIDHVIALMGLDAAHDALDRAFWAALIELSDRGVRPMPGVYGFVAHLQSLGLRLGVASNSVTAYVRKALAQIELLPLFDSISGVDQVAEGKPAPDIYLNVARNLGCAPERCLAVEDSPSGVQAATAAGMTCVLVPNPDLALVGNCGAHFVFPSLVHLDRDLERVLSSPQATGVSS